MEHGSIPTGSLITSIGRPNLMIEKAKQSRYLPVLSVSHHLELKISLQETTLCMQTHKDIFVSLEGSDFCDACFFIDKLQRTPGHFSSP